MRSLFGLLIAISSLVSTGCTRANPDALFNLPQQDLLAPGNSGGNGASGGGGGIAGGGGSSGGGGGVVSGDDLAVTHDLAVESHDMAESTSGIKCGTTVCSAASKDSCCITATMEMCIDINMTCGANGAIFACDGPEDCTTTPGETACCGSTGASTAPKGATCGSPLLPTCVPLCHALADCGTGWLGCCPVANTPYSRCSRTACK